MKKDQAKKSPLEKLAEVAQKQQLPVKVKPKDRFKTLEPVDPIVEDSQMIDVFPVEELPVQPGDPNSKKVIISNSSVTFNVNLDFNVDDKAVDRAIETSKQVAKGIAAAGAAMLGTAFLLTNNKKVDNVKIPLMPKVKVPNLKKKKTD
jgi:hypothetical protein